MAYTHVSGIKPRQGSSIQTMELAKMFENNVQNIPKDVAGWLGYDATGPRFQKFRKLCSQKFSNAFEESTNLN